MIIKRKWLLFVIIRDYKSFCTEKESYILLLFLYNFNFFSLYFCLINYDVNQL